MKLKRYNPAIQLLSHLHKTAMQNIPLNPGKNPPLSHMTPLTSTKHPKTQINNRCLLGGLPESFMQINIPMYERLPSVSHPTKPPPLYSCTWYLSMLYRKWSRAANPYRAPYLYHSFPPRRRRSAS